MDLSFEWQGETYPLCQDVDKWTLGEMRAVERWIGLPFEQMSRMDGMTAAIGISIKRVKPQFRITDADSISMETIQAMQEQVDAAKEAATTDVVPTVPAGGAVTEEALPLAGPRKRSPQAKAAGSSS